MGPQPLVRRLRNVALVLLGMLLAVGLRATGALDTVAQSAQLVAPAAGGLRTGFDPLSAAERQQALDLARAAPAVVTLLQGAARTEVLSVERHDEAKADVQRGAWPRRAGVYIYLYDQDQLVHAVIDLGKRAATSMELLRDTQLPPTAAEAARAVQLALADPQAGAAIRAQYQQVTGTTLTGADQLRGQASVFRADSQSGAIGPAAACGRHRCARLLLTTVDGRTLPLLPIVDLSAGTLALPSP